MHTYHVCKRLLCIMRISTLINPHHTHVTVTVVQKSVLCRTSIQRYTHLLRVPGVEIPVTLSLKDRSRDSNRLAVESY
jgi:hypothetical protein